jgi:hypothetical protein
MLCALQALRLPFDLDPGRRKETGSPNNQEKGSTPTSRIP